MNQKFSFLNDWYIILPSTLVYRLGSLVRSRRESWEQGYGSLGIEDGLFYFIQLLANAHDILQEVHRINCGQCHNYRTLLWQVQLKRN